MSIFHDQAEFLKAGDVKVPSSGLKGVLLAETLVEEEFKEWQEEDTHFPLPNHDKIKEALDLMYVCAQYLNVTLGPDKAKECWDLVHQNNMSKCTDGKLVKREDGKILKPKNYTKVNLGEVLYA